MITDSVAIISGAMEGIGRAAALRIRRAADRSISVGRVGKPEGIGDAHMWLRSEDVSFVARETMVIDERFCSHYAAGTLRAVPHSEIRRGRKADDE